MISLPSDTRRTRQSLVHSRLQLSLYCDAPTAIGMIEQTVRPQSQHWKAGALVAEGGLEPSFALHLRLTEYKKHLGS